MLAGRPASFLEARLTSSSTIMIRRKLSPTLNNDREKIRHQWMSKLKAYLLLDEKEETCFVGQPKLHQKRAMEQYLQKLEANSLTGGASHAVFPLSTGAGKTFIFTRLAELLAKNSGKTIKDLKEEKQSLSNNESCPKTLIVVPTITLMEQTIRSVKGFAPDLRYAQLKSKCDDIENIRIGTLNKKNIQAIVDNSDVMVVTYDTLQQYYKEVPWDKIGLVVLDEAHNALSADRCKMVEHAKDAGCTILGFTATPTYNLKKEAREAKEQLNIAVSAMKLPNTDGLPSVYELLGYKEDGSDNPIQPLNIAEAILLEVNSPVAYDIIEVDVENIESVEEKSAEIDCERLSHIINKEEYNFVPIDIYMNKESPVTHLPFRGKKGVVFCAGIEHAKKMAQAFNDNIKIEDIDPNQELEKKYKENVAQHFLQRAKESFAKASKLTVEERVKRSKEKATKDAEKFIASHPFGIAKAVHSANTNKKKNPLSFEADVKSLDRRECQNLILQYQLGGLRFLTGADILTEGFDDVETEVIFNLRPTQSENKQIQRCGRGLRLNPKDPNKVCHIFDFKWGNSSSCYFNQFIGKQFTAGILPQHKNQSAVYAPEKVEFPKMAKYISHYANNIALDVEKRKRKSSSLSQEKKENNAAKAESNKTNQFNKKSNQKKDLSKKQKINHSSKVEETDQLSSISRSIDNAKMDVDSTEEKGVASSSGQQPMLMQIEEEKKKDAQPLSDEECFSLLDKCSGTTRDIVEVIESIPLKFWSKQDSEGRIPLMVILQKKQTHYDIIRKLLEKIAGNNCETLRMADSNGDTVLHYLFCYRGGMTTYSMRRLINKIMDKYPGLINQVNLQGKTPLQTAICVLMENNNVKMILESITYLLGFAKAKGTNHDVNQINDKDGKNLLDYAIDVAQSTEDVKLLQLLLTNPERISFTFTAANREKLKKTAPRSLELQAMLRENYFDQLCPELSKEAPQRLMVSVEAKVDADYFAAFIKHSEEFLQKSSKFFLTHKLQAGLGNHFSINSIIENTQIVKCATAYNNDGDTPLHLAILSLTKYPADLFPDLRKVHEQAICEYFNYLGNRLDTQPVKLDWNVPNKNGFTLLDYAVAFDSSILIEALIQKGARVCQPENRIKCSVSAALLPKSNIQVNYTNTGTRVSFFNHPALKAYDQIKTYDQFEAEFQSQLMRI